MSPSAPSCLLDTNVLLAATDTSRRTHRAALDLLNDDPRAHCVTPQIVREYLAVSTRPVEANGLGLSPQTATNNLDELLLDMTLLPEDARTTARLTHLVRDGHALSRQVHDANIAASALAHAVPVIVTDNDQHFRRFSDLVTIETLSRR
ncbi:MAG: PIN domain-containing protein [Aeromicrobium sp.]|uniref:type II toxin-antitoxin system VapC family toxin n=1 Tax=Aeromicrobium sp. TaxID=1871063 RepID=UPI0039E727BF